MRAKKNDRKWNNTIIVHNCRNLIIEMFYQRGDRKLWFLLCSHFICETLRTHVSSHSAQKLN